jgi:nucleotide-binding universal stress UspA family protein
MTRETYIRPVLVGIDGTPSGLEALSLASALAVLTGAPLVLGAVYGFEPMTSAFGGLAWRLVTTEAASIAHGLTRVAEDEDAALLVLGSRRYGPLRSTLLGGVSTALVECAHCPVLTVPRGVHEDASLSESGDAAVHA